MGDVDNREPPGMGSAWGEGVVRERRSIDLPAGNRSKIQLGRQGGIIYIVVVDMMSSRIPTKVIQRLELMRVSSTELVTETIREDEMARSHV